MPPRSPGFAAVPRQALPVLDFLLPWARPASALPARRAVGPSQIRRMAHAAVIIKDERDSLAGAQHGDEAQFVSRTWAPTAQDRKGKGRAIELLETHRVRPRPSAIAIYTPLSEASRSDGYVATTSSSSPEQAQVASSSFRSSSTHQPTEGEGSVSQLTDFRSSRPPDPKALLAKMRSDESLLTLDNGIRLAQYAERMSDLRVAREVKDLIGRSRLAPLSWTRARGGSVRRGHRSRRPRPAGTMETAASTETLGALTGEAGDLLEFASPGQADYPAGKARSTIKTQRPRVNQNLAHLWPPRLSNLTPRASVDDYLCHLHASLMPGAGPKRPTIQQALSALRALEPTPTAYHLRAVLHLFLAYPPGHAFSPTRLASGRWSRDTVHMLEEMTARYPQFEPGHQTLLLSVLPFTRDYRTLPFPRGTRTGILRLIKLFEIRWRRSPTSETWRYIGRWASWARDEKLAKLAWEGWWQEWAKREDAVSEDSSHRNRWNILRPDQATPMERRTVETTPISSPGLPFVFERRGRLLMRWRKVMDKFAERGWLLRRDTGVKVSPGEKVDLWQVDWRQASGRDEVMAGISSTSTE